MSVIDELRQAKSTAHAIRILAKEVARLQQRVADLENAGVEEPFSWDFIEPEDREEGDPPLMEGDVGTIELPDEWDSMTEEQQGAWLRLAADGGGEINATTGATEVTFEGAPEDGGVTATFPPAPPELHERWAQEGEAICAGVEAKSGLTPRAAADAYAKGGPLWLAAWNHEFVMGLPTGMRQAMVADVAEYAPQAAIALGRDILRVSTDGQQEWARQAAGV